MQYSNELLSRRSSADEDAALHESVSLPTALSSRSCSKPTVGEEHRQWMIAQTQTTLAIIYSHQSALKYVDSCCVLLLSADVRRDCVRRFESQAHNL